MESVNDFKLVISTVLNNWIGLKMALENGMGGTPAMTRQKLTTLIELVHESLVKTKNLSNVEWESVSDVMADYLDDSMDVIFEDNSPDEVAVQIVDLYKLYAVANHSELLSAIQRMKYNTPIVSDVLNVNVPLLQDDDSMTVDSDEDGPPEPSPDEADGWTVVKKK